MHLISGSANDWLNQLKDISANMNFLIQPSVATAWLIGEWVILTLFQLQLANAFHILQCVMLERNRLTQTERH